MRYSRSPGRSRLIPNNNQVSINVEALFGVHASAIRDGHATQIGLKRQHRFRNNAGDS